MGMHRSLRGNTACHDCRREEAVGQGHKRNLFRSLQSEADLLAPTSVEVLEVKVELDFLMAICLPLMAPQA